MTVGMARFAVLLCLLLARAPATAGAAVSSPSTWDVAQQRAVVAAGLMAPVGDGRFHGEEPLTGGQLNNSLLQIGFQLGVPAVVTAQPFVTVADFDRLMVRQLGLADAADAVQAEAARVGLAPPRYFGTEVVARLLGLRYNHPFPWGEALELYPWDHITRAEAAWSEDVILGFQDFEVQEVSDELTDFTLPDYTPAQRSVLRTAVSKIGMPYIWGGETDGRSFGQVHGGYDCSGLVYRAFATRGMPRLTAAAYAGAIPKRARIRFDDLRPGDLMFFGDAKFWSRSTERSITHTAIVMGNGWLINSSSQGVAMGRMDGWRQENFAWGRRVL